MTSRDLAVLPRLGEGRATALEDVRSLLLLHNAQLGYGSTTLSVRATRYVVDRWAAAGFVSVHTNPLGGNALIAAERPCAGLPNMPSGMTFGLPPMATLEHTVRVQSVGVHLASLGYEWCHEAWLPWQEGHRPDGLARSESVSFAVEVDLTRKTRDRWLRLAHLNIQQYGLVVYYVAGPLLSMVNKWVDLEHLGGVIRVQQVPCPVAAPVESDGIRGGAGHAA